MEKRVAALCVVDLALGKIMWHRAAAVAMLGHRLLKYQRPAEAHALLEQAAALAEAAG